MRTASLSRLTLMAYALPAYGAGAFRFMVLMYLMKFSTDVLLIAPAIIGFGLGLSRLWDAVSDPLCGYLSDRSTSRMGRRRSWLAASAVAFPAVALALWRPPRSLSDAALDTWMVVALLLFFTVSTLHAVPYDSLGAELTDDHHGRTRVFAYRRASFMLGMLTTLGLVGWLTSADDKRVVGGWIGTSLGLAAAVTTLMAVALLREPPAARRRGPSSPLGATRDVWRNQHARLLLAVFFVARLGSAVLASLGAYLSDYLVGDEALLPWLIGAYAGSAIVFIPMGQALARRFGKRPVWSASMLVSALAFASLFLVEPGDVGLVLACAIVVGVADSTEAMIGRSMQADVIDADEAATGERKEGVYFAAWGFASKSAAGASVLVSGLALQVAGYTPNVVQSPQSELTLRVLLSLVPCGATLAAFLLSRRYQLDERLHAEMMSQIRTAPPVGAP